MSRCWHCSDAPNFEVGALPNVFLILKGSVRARTLSSLSVDLTGSEKLRHGRTRQGIFFASDFGSRKKLHKL